MVDTPRVPRPRKPPGKKADRLMRVLVTPAEEAMLKAAAVEAGALSFSAWARDELKRAARRVRRKAKEAP